MPYLPTAVSCEAIARVFPDIYGMKVGIKKLEVPGLCDSEHRMSLYTVINVDVLPPCSGRTDRRTDAACSYGALYIDERAITQNILRWLSHQINGNRLPNWNWKWKLDARNW